MICYYCNQVYWNDQGEANCKISRCIIPGIILYSKKPCNCPLEEKRIPLTDEQILDLNEKYGYFEYGDAQGDKTEAFVRSVERMHGI